MIKWFAYIVVLLIFAPCLSSAKIKNSRFDFVCNKLEISLPLEKILADTSTVRSKRLEQEEKKKIKEVAKARKQPKPERVEPGDNQATPKVKPKRERRPEGLERPPEIPRRNGN
jgi:outer membrane biosynthesis protein TonB